MSKTLSCKAMDAPLKPDIAHAAAVWFVLTSESSNEKDHQDLQLWRKADPEHERAWEQTQNLIQQFDGLNPASGLAALDRPAAQKRRQAVKHLALLLTVGAVGTTTYKKINWNISATRYQTATGEQRNIKLAEGTQLLMNTATTVDIIFNAGQRLVLLNHGEIMIQTGHENEIPYRPFQVKTAQGMLTALGTRFLVRQDENNSRLNVQEGAVQIEPSLAPNAIKTLKAGEQTRFDNHVVGTIQTNDIAREAWVTGMLFADQMPLGEFIAELSRYRKGYLGCDPAVANLTISGSFPIVDTNVVLQSLVATLPIRLTMVTRYWVQVGAM